MNKDLRIGRKFLCLVIALVMVMTLIPRLPASLAYAAAGDVPAHDKVLTVNGDGTYTIALNVTGDSEKQIQKVNVIVIVDRSNSMDTQSGTGAYVPSNQNGTNMYGLVDGEYVALTRTDNGYWANPRYTYTVTSTGESYTGQRYQYDGTATRLEATRAAVDGLAGTLLAYNGKDGNPDDTVEMALVSFATASQIPVTSTTDASTYTTAVNAINTPGGNAGGTNWESALQTAATINFNNDGDPTYVIFFSDGAPTFYGTGPSGTGGETEPNMSDSYNAATDDAAALAQKVGVNNFYTIFAYGSAAGQTYMTNLTAAAGAPAANNYSASNTAELNDAFAAILEAIELAGIGAVSMEDGTTSSVETTTGEISNLLTVDESSYKYYRAGGDYSDIEDYDPDNGEYGAEWADAPEASFEDGAVKWNLESEGVLENEVTYTVTFDCWPSQTTLDIAADIKNDPSSYNSLDENIKKYINPDGSLKTNTTASFSYTDTRTGKSNSEEYDNPDPVTTSAIEQLAISKEWENDLDGQQAEPIVLTVTRDEEPHYTMRLGDPEDPDDPDSPRVWTDDIFISIGILRHSEAGAYTDSEGEKFEVLEKGHDFTFEEPSDLGYYWELEVPTVRPMLVDGTMTMLILKEAKAPYNNPDNTTEYTIEGKTYYTGATGAASLTAVNHRRARLNITKVVDGEDADPDQTFPFTVTVNDSKASEGSEDNLNSDYWVWFSVWNGGPVDCVTSEANKEYDEETGEWTGYYYVKSGTAIQLDLKEGDNLRFLNLPTDTKYTIVEGTLPANYAFTSAELTSGEDEGFSGDQTSTGTIVETETDYTVTYTNTYGKSAVEIIKVWDDADNQDGKRPTTEEFKSWLKLLADGTDVTSANADKLTVTEGEDEDGNTIYTAEWTELDRYADGEEIEYTVTETPSDDYEADVTTAEDHGTITNTHEPEVTDLSVEKVWDDADNRDALRPTSVSVQLKADGTAKGDPITLNESNEWAYTWSNLPKNNAGRAIEYTVEEAPVENYTTNYDLDEATRTYTITNSYTPEVTSYTFNKTWDDNENQDGVRPTTISAQLYADGTAYGEPVTINAQGQWSYTWSELPKNSAGTAIEYTAKELNASGSAVENNGALDDNYTATYSTTATSTTVTNTHNVEKTQYTVTKTWNDANNQDGIRPTSVSVQLLADGTAKGDPVTLDASNSWSYTWEDLDKKSNGTVIDYSVAEITAIDGYTTVGPTEAEDGLSATIENTHETEKSNYTVSKSWVDADDQDGVRPTSIQVQLYADGVAEGEPVTVSENEDGTWSYTWTDLPVNKDGEEITYSAKELDADGAAVEDGEDYDDNYTASYTSTDTSTTITNTHETLKTYYTINKAWDDANDQDGVRPESVQAQLYADGVAEGDAVTITVGDDGTWSYTWNDLPVNKAGTEITYSAKELDASGAAVENNGAYNDDYTATYSTTDTSTTVTNTHTPAEIKIIVSKTWEDENDQDGVRPSSVTVNLLANGEAAPREDEDATVQLSASNSWQYTWDKLPEYANGEKITYSVTEDDVAEYTESVGDLTETEEEGVYTVEVTNTHNVEKTTVTVTKVWDDNDDQDGLRPESISVTLLANGVEADVEDATATLDEDGDWTYTWEDLDVNKAGSAIEYSVDEVEVEGYETEIGEVTGSAAEGFEVEITNEHEPLKTTVTVIKVWEDEDDQDGIRPESISVTLLADGEEADVEDATATLNEDGEWTYTWEELDAYKEGELIEYSVDEVEVEGYETEIGEVTGDAEEGYEVEITNTHEVDKTTVTVTKVWEDNDDQDGIRPESISVTLLADGEEADVEDATATLNEDNDWTYTWEDLDVNKAGTAIEYSVDEVEVEEYETEIGDVTGSAAEGFEVEITNTHEVYKTTVTVTKVWEDEDDQDGIRPDSISVTLLADGEEADVEDATATLNEDNDWTYTWEDLDVNKAGTAIEYSVDEVEVEEYETEIGEVTGDAEEGFEVEITNTHEVYKTTVTVTKSWDDRDDKDGLRPDSIEVVLLADGEEADVEDATATLSEDNKWTYTWEDLDVNKAGTAIEYSVDEVEVEGYETEIGEVTGDAENGFKVEITNYHKASYDKVMIDPPVKKVVKGNPSKDETFTFQMKALTDGAPMPDGAKDGVLTMDIVGSGEKEFGEAWFDKPGQWKYEITEVNTKAENYTYDNTVYTLIVDVKEVADGTQFKLEKTETIVGGNGQIVFTNTYEEPPIPTGDTTIVVPYIVIGVSALILLLMLLFRTRKNRA